MDLWVVAALTGAGYAAKYLSRDKEGVPLQKSAYTTTRSEDQHQAYYRDGGNFCQNMLQRNSAIASTSGFQDDICDSYNEGIQPSPRALATLRCNTRGRNLLRTRHNNQMQYPRPLDALESCLMAQICKQHSQTPLPSPCIPSLRPFVVTDGTQVISRPSFETCNTISETNESVFGGIYRLSERGSQQNSAVQRLSSIREMPNRTQRSLQVPPSGAALFCLGVSVGVLYRNFANKSEVIKLKDVLKQSEKLVQDLEEELEMKDSLTVNEVVRVDNVLPNDQDTCVNSNILSVSHFQLDSQATGAYCVENSDYRKGPENSASMNQIEAELEAELERLELNMNGQMKSSDDDNDEHMVAELIEGELRADNIPSSDPSSSSSSRSCSLKQSVSPRELSLRLHQVIESRLEQRIMELKRALERSQKRVRQLEHNDVSSSLLSPPITVEAERKLPLVMNLSGEALDAYNEAFEQLSKIDGATFVDEDEDGDDMELLIRQIVEKTRQGSSAILHAHRAMISLDI